MLWKVFGLREIGGWVGGWVRCAQQQFFRFLLVCLFPIRGGNQIRQCCCAVAHTPSCWSDRFLRNFFVFLCFWLGANRSASSPPTTRTPSRRWRSSGTTRTSRSGQRSGTAACSARRCCYPWASRRYGVPVSHSNSSMADEIRSCLQMYHTRFFFNLYSPDTTVTPRLAPRTPP